MLFSRTSVSTATPPPLSYSLLIGGFLLKLDPSWSFPTFTEWDLLVATQGTGLWSGYDYYTTVTGGKSYYHFTDVDPALHYAFKYVLKSKFGTSQDSTPATVGKCKLIVPSGSTYVITEL